MRHPHLSPSKSAWVRADEKVSWLEAAVLAFPGPESQWPIEGACFRPKPGLSQWRGRAGLSPASECLARADVVLSA